MLIKQKAKVLVQIILLTSAACLLIIGYSYLFFHEFTPENDISPQFRSAIFYPLATPCPNMNYQELNSDDSEGTELQKHLIECKQNKINNTSHAHSVHLPHEWKDNKKPTHYGWYSMTVSANISLPDEPLQLQSTLWSMVIPKANMSIAVLINDTLVGWNGTFNNTSKNNNRPLRFSFPDSTLQHIAKTPEAQETQEIRVDIYLESTRPHQGFLGEIYLLPKEMTEKSFQHSHFLKVDLLTIILALQIAFGINIFILWLQSTVDIEYGFFSLGTFLWAVSSYSYSTPHILISPTIQDWLFYTSTGFLSINTMYFIHRLFGEKYTRYESVVLMIGIALSATMLLYDEYLYYAGKVLLTFGYLLGAYILFYSIYKIHRVRRIELATHITYTGALILSLIFATHDLGAVLGLLPWSNGMYIGYASIAIILAFSWLLIRRFVLTREELALANRSLIDLNTELNTLNKSLEKRIQEQCKILDQHYVKKTDNERESLVRDMHDGVGLYLATILNELDQKEPDHSTIKRLSQDALTDLRLIVDSMGTANNDIGRILGMFRQRIAPHLEHAGIELQWEVDILPEIQRFGSEEALHLLRICQEALANILKYAEASRIRISAKAHDNNTIIVIIQDNGNGFDTQTAHKGAGLKNLSQRVDKIGAILTIHSQQKQSTQTKSGTKIQLIIPIG